MKFNSTAEKDRHYICEIGKLFWGDNKQCYASDAVYRKVKSLLESDRPNEQDLDKDKWFGKGCEFLVAQWEGSEYTDGPNYMEFEPVLKFCNHVNNDSDTEGNCTTTRCPIK